MVMGEDTGGAAGVDGITDDKPKPNVWLPTLARAGEDCICMGVEGLAGERSRVIAELIDNVGVGATAALEDDNENDNADGVGAAAAAAAGAATVVKAEEEWKDDDVHAAGSAAVAALDAAMSMVTGTTPAMAVLSGDGECARMISAGTGGCCCCCCCCCDAK